MVPREAGRGRSFKGAGLYYLRDRNAHSSDRIGFTHTENVPTSDASKALKWMAWTAIHAERLKYDSGAKATGRPCERPVYTFSLAWHPEEEPKKWDMIRAGRRALIVLGLQDHETVMVSHTDRPHPHMHLIVNVIHPETGRASRLSFSRKKLSVWAEEYEREHGKIYCRKRVENNAKRQQGENVKHSEPELDVKARITELYHASDSGEAFRAALAEKGFTLAQGKRIVLIDREGKIHSLSRQIDGVKANDIKAKLSGLKLPDVDTARGDTEKDAKQQKPQPASEREAPKLDPEEKTEPQYYDRDQQDRDWQESIIDAAIAPKPKPPLRPEPTPTPQKHVETGLAQRAEPAPFFQNLLQDRHLAELGNFYESNARARRRLEATFEQQYGEQERGLRRDIAHLDNLLSNSGWARRTWLKLTRQVPKNPQEELQNLRLTLDNIEWRKAEASAALNSDIERSRHAIEARHTREREELQPKALQQEGYPAPYESECEDFQEDEDFGPSFEY